MPKLLRSARIVGNGHYSPDKVLSNFDLEKMVDTSNEWIVSRTGIHERRIVTDDQAASDLAAAAAISALEDSGFDAEDLDAVIVSTVTSDVRFPATACFVQNKLGAWNAVAFDLCGACSGFVYALSTAHAFIASGKMERIMVIGVEILSKFVDWEDRSTCVLFGDGAGAAVIEACGRDEGIMGTYMKSNGSLTDLLYIPAGGSRMPFDAKKQEKKDHCIKMKGDGVFKYAVRAMSDAITKVLGNAGASLQDVDLFIPHQANIRIIDAIAEKLSIPSEKVVVNLDRLGNTSSASIPIAFDEAVRAGRLKSGDLVLLVSFGGGLTWGSVLLRYS